MNYQKTRQTLQKLRKNLAHYQKLFMEDGFIDSDEQRTLDELQQKIDRAEAAIEDRTSSTPPEEVMDRTDTIDDQDDLLTNTDEDVESEENTSDEETATPNEEGGPITNTDEEVETDTPNEEGDPSTPEVGEETQQRLGVDTDSLPIEIPDISGKTPEEQDAYIRDEILYIGHDHNTVTGRISQSIEAQRRVLPQEATKVYAFKGRIEAFLINYNKLSAELQAKYSEDKTRIEGWLPEAEAVIAQLQRDLEHSYGNYDASVVEAFVLGEGDINDIDPNDVDQGALGNCYFMAAIASVAHNNPQRLRDLITDNGDGTYDVKLYVWSTSVGTVGKPVIIRVTNEMFTNRSGDFIYAGSGDGELWVALLEKAFAIYVGSYKAMSSGNAEAGLETITGVNANNHSFFSMSEEEILQLLQTAVDEKKDAVLGTSPAGRVESRIELPDGQILFSSHAYSLISISGQTVDLQNPHGENHLSISIAIIKEHFGYVSITE